MRERGEAGEQERNTPNPVKIPGGRVQAEERRSKTRW